MSRQLLSKIFSGGICSMPCLFHMLTGWYCPGCGGTRALFFLLTGHPLLSFLFHPLVLYTVCGLILLCFSRLVLRRKNGRGIAWFLWGALLVTAANFIIKNAALLLFDVDLLQYGRL